MPHIKANAAAAAHLQTLRPGAGIVFDVNGKETSGKFTSYHPGALKFLCSVGKDRTPTWVELNRLKMPSTEPVAAPAPEPSFLRMENAWSAEMPNELRERMDNCEQSYEDFSRDAYSATELAKEILEDFKDDSHKLNEELVSSHKETAKDARANQESVAAWLKKHGRERPAVEPVVEQERPHVGELGQRVLVALGAAGVPMLANDLAAAVGENIRKAAGSFPALVKAGLIESHGGENKKGGKMIELTTAGWEYVGANGTAIHGGAEYVDTPEPTEAAPALPVASTALECTEAHVLAMEAVGGDGMDVTDVFVANLLTDLAEHHPWPVAKFPPRNNPDAYFFAALTGEGEEYVVFMRETLRMGPKPVPAVVAGKLGAKRNGAIMAEGTRIQRSESQRLRASKKAVVEDGLATRTTGRAGAARQSLREVVLSALAGYSAERLSVGYKLTVKDLQVDLSLTALQVQNALFKLTKAGFLATDEQGRTANPVALTERGKTGYSTNHDGQPLRPLIEAAIAEGLDDAAVALRVRCDIGYVHDVRTNRRIKPKAVAVGA